MKIPRLPERPENAHKGYFGKLLIVAGSRGMIGAGCLAANTALRAGCGLVYLAMPETAQKKAASQVLSGLTLPLTETKAGSISDKALQEIEIDLKDKDCLAIGPGLSTHTETVQFVWDLLEQKLNIPVVIDADALNALAQNPEILEVTCKVNEVVLTPHPGEFARLTNTTISEVQNNREDSARKFAEKFPGVTLVLKGHKTIICQDDKMYINTTGNAGLAKGGSGDVLTGLIAGFITQKMSPFDASVLAVYLHGLAAEFASEELTQYCMTAEDLIAFLPKVFKKHLLTQ